MLTTALAQLRVAAAAVRGRPAPLGALARLTTAALATRREFGSLGPDGAEAVAGPPLDPATVRDVQLRRFRTQATRAANDTAYYAARFAALGLDPATLDWDAIARLPLTPKTALRDDPDAFVRRGTVPVLRATTHGTTGFPTAVCFSARELRLIAAHSGLGFAVTGHLDATDVVQIHTSARGLLGNWSLTSGAARVGALVQPVGTVEPALALSLLARELTIPGKKPKVSAISTYPSYLGALVEAAPALGYTPADFALHRIMVGGEIVTRGLKDRARRLFGDVAFDEGWAMSETFPCGGTRCEAGHLHTDPSHALVEVLDPTTREPTPPGAIGTLVVTPFPALRETTLLLRYDTEDVVRTLAAPATCSLRTHPAASDLLGKRRLAVPHDAGTTYPREVLEALEAVEAVPLPARCGFRAVPGGVAVEVTVREDDPATRLAVSQSLESHGVPIRDLRLVTDHRRLEHPFPLRGDLREQPFATAPTATNHRHDDALAATATVVVLPPGLGGRGGRTP